MERMAMSIDGMSCGHCVSAVRAALTAVDGVTVEEVKVGSAIVSYDPARTRPDEIVGAVADGGYRARAAA